MLRFACPGCKKVLSAPEERAGVVVSCPQCKKPIKVPVAAPGVAPPPPAPALSPVAPQGEGGGVAAASPEPRASAKGEEELPELELVLREAPGFVPIRAARHAGLRMELPENAPPEAFELGPILHITRLPNLLPLTHIPIPALAAISAAFTLLCIMGIIRKGEPQAFLGLLFGLAGCALTVFLLWRQDWKWLRPKDKPFRSVTDRRILCRDGIIAVNDNKFTICRWEDVDSIYLSLTELHVQAAGVTVSKEKQDSLTVRLNDGRRIEFLFGFPMQDRSLEVLELKTRERLLERARAALRAGANADFDGLYVSQAGIGGGGGFVHWNEISQIIVERGKVKVLGADLEGPSVLDQALDKVANLSVLLALVDAIRQGQR